ncbi:MAG: hypothetical protein KKC79_00575 [Gammaproteobacteria bacterium]|nr:hypothetical protein [Gammaproteobacteria bacterium]MBU1442216.1 hypothetical protein [Gammaproteobacteria bacterium]MBU2285464.1 hypothetical protein [Gammaproteobacteria bacterium]MBU2407124.1 hypothetical protein [Gammaproteobacteria bacterium]
MTALGAEARDRLYAECARAISEAGEERESLFLARLALLLFEQVADEASCRAALAQALDGLPVPSLSASSTTPGTTAGE